MIDREELIQPHALKGQAIESEARSTNDQGQDKSNKVNLMFFNHLFRSDCEKGIKRL